MDSTYKIVSNRGKPDPSTTETTRRRFQCLSTICDRMEGMMEKRYQPWREKLWLQVPGVHVLEVGVGTGKNFAFYPAGISITVIDLTPGILQHAQKRIGELTLKPKVKLHLGDVQELDFPKPSSTLPLPHLYFVLCLIQSLDRANLSALSNRAGGYCCLNICVHLVRL